MTELNSTLEYKIRNIYKKLLQSFFDKSENFNYLNVAFISYKLTMWDLMLFSDGHTRGQRLRKKDRSC